MVGSGSAPHSSNCTRLWCSKYPQKQTQDLPREAEVRRPSPHHRKTDPLEGLRQVQDQGQGSLIFFLRFAIQSFHLHQYFPYCLLSSSVSAIRGVAIHSILLLPLRHFWCSQSFPPTNQRRHKRNWSFTRDILRNQRKHRRAWLVAPFSTLFHLFR